MSPNKMLAIVSVVVGTLAVGFGAAPYLPLPSPLQKQMVQVFYPDKMYVKPVVQEVGSILNDPAGRGFSTESEIYKHLDDWRSMVPDGTRELTLTPRVCEREGELVAKVCVDVNVKWLDDGTVTIYEFRFPRWDSSPPERVRKTAETKVSAVFNLFEFAST